MSYLHYGCQNKNIPSKGQVLATAEHAKGNTLKPCFHLFHIISFFFQFEEKCIIPPSTH